MEERDIIKANDLCSKTPQQCKDCPFCKFDDCVSELAEKTIDLINRQQAEIKKCENIIRLADKTIEKQSAEIKRLEQENFDRSLTVETWKWEAVKEFAERLKKESFNGMNIVIPEEVVLIDDIDNLVKEMVGASDG